MDFLEAEEGKAHPAPEDLTRTDRLVILIHSEGWVVLTRTGELAVRSWPKLHCDNLDCQVADVQELLPDHGS